MAAGVLNSPGGRDGVRPGRQQHHVAAVDDDALQRDLAPAGREVRPHRGEVRRDLLPAGTAPGPGQFRAAGDVPVDLLGEQLLDAVGVLPAEALHERLGHGPRGRGVCRHRRAPSSGSHLM
jgi:hypothetical protein